MMAYTIRRLLLVIPTLFGVMVVNFFVVQFAPGGPVDQRIAQAEGMAVEATARTTGEADELGRTAGQETTRTTAARDQSSQYRGAQGVSPALQAKLEEQYGFDKPVVERFFRMIGQYLRFDFGDSFYRQISVVDLVIEKLPVSISLGFWMLLLSYGISIPLGIRKAVKDGSRFDAWTSIVVIIGYAIPGFLFAILLVVLFAGGSFLNIFPLRFLTSSGWDQFPLWHKILDYLWHLVLPITALAVGAFATSTIFVKNLFLDEIRKQYVITARAKGLTERRVLYGHVFRNAMLLVIAGFPGAFIGAFFGGSLLVEVIFNLDGLGLLGYTSAVSRDYPVLFGTLYVFGLLGLVIGIVSDLAYTWVDPRIDFLARRA